MIFTPKKSKTGLVKFGVNRVGKHIQIGHRFEIHFKQPIVKDKMIYKDENSHSKGYHVQSGRRLSKTSTFKGFTKNGVNKVGYERKKKIRKLRKHNMLRPMNTLFNQNKSVTVE